MNKQLIGFIIIFSAQCLGMELAKNLETEQQQFFAAIQAGDSAAVGRMIQKSPKIISVQDSRFTSLMLACKSNKKEIVEQLLLRGANPDQHNEQGLHPIHLARSIEVLELLHNAGANLNAQNENKTTVILFLAYQEKYDCIEWLLQKGAVVTGDLLERINNYRLHEDFLEASAVQLLGILQPNLVPDECCVCFEEKKWPAIKYIPCPSKKMSVLVAHVNEFLCIDCYEGIKKTTNCCPLCREPLK